MLKIYETLHVLDDSGRELCLFIEIEMKDNKYFVFFSIGRNGKLFGNYSQIKKEFLDKESAKKYLIDRLNIFKLHKFIREFKSDLHPIFQNIRRQIIEY